MLPTCPVEGRISSEYGMRTHPISKRKKKHYGIDFAASRGTDVRSVWPGVVVRSTWRRGGFGQFIVVESGAVRVLYAHLSSRAVRYGDVVAAGGLLGAVGSSGSSTGPHLHLQLRLRSRWRDPGPALKLCRPTG